MQEREWAVLGVWTTGCFSNYPGGNGERITAQILTGLQSKSSPG